MADKTRRWAIWAELNPTPDIALREQAAADACVWFNGATPPAGGDVIRQIVRQRICEAPDNARILAMVKALPEIYEAIWMHGW